MTTSTPQRTNTTALLAAFAGVLGFCFWGVGGVLAIVLGLAARAEIARSAGREGGNAAAIAGIALGGLNVASCIVGMAVGIALLARPSPPAPLVTAPPVVAAPVPTASATSGRSRGGPAANASRERTQRETTFGNVRVVDLAPGGDSLRRLLEHEEKSATRSEERLLLFIVGPDCLPCNGLMLALNDPRMQTALRQVRLVRINAAEFTAELTALGVPTETLPGFALMTSGLNVSDYVDGGEWDADIAPNIAPVLGAFLQGKYKARRHSFRREGREDETAL